MKTIQQVLQATREQLRNAGLATPDLDARLLLQSATGVSQEEVLLNNKIISDFESKTLIDFVSRRLAHEPVSRIIGERPFWKSEFKISPETLDPRSDSEVLIEQTLACVEKNKPLHILDMGTGTGCLLLSVLQELPHATGIGIDISPGAIQVAQENAERLALAGRVQFLETSWTNFIIENKFNIIISNPPYIAPAEIPGLEPEVREYDPLLALIGGEDGLECYRQIARVLPQALAENGHVFLEIGATQAEAVKDILAVQGFRVLKVAPDLGGHDRCLVVQRA